MGAVSRTTLNEVTERIENVIIIGSGPAGYTAALYTARANLSVGPPYDLGIYHNGSLAMNEHRIESDSPYLEALQDAWLSTLMAAVDTLPALPADLVD